MKGGKRVECTVCHDKFPCDDEVCRHFDCQAERAEPGCMIKLELGFE